VPSDAIPVGSVPRSSPTSSVPARSTTPNLLDVDRIWRVPGSPREVLAITRHSHPAGLRINGGGSAGEHAAGEREHEYLWYVTLQARPQRGLNSEQLAISTIAAPQRSRAVPESSGPAAPRWKFQEGHHVVPAGNAVGGYFLTYTLRAGQCGFKIRPAQQALGLPANNVPAVG